MDNCKYNAETRFADAGLALLMDLSAESDGNMLWEEYCTSNCAMPPALDIQCRRQIQKAIQKNKWHSRAIRFLKTTCQLAASFAVILFLVVSLVTSVEAIRVPVLNFILKHSPHATAILFQSSSTSSQTQLEELCSILKYSAPEGYILEVEQIYRDKYSVPPTVTSVFMAFQDENDAILTIHVAPAKGSWSVDTEDATVTQLELSGQEAILIEKHPEIQIIWVNKTQELFYHITADSMEKSDFMQYVTMLAKETKNSNGGLNE